MRILASSWKDVEVATFTTSLVSHKAWSSRLFCVEKLISPAILRLTQRVLRIGDQLWLLQIGKIVVARNRVQWLMNVAAAVIRRACTFVNCETLFGVRVRCHERTELIMDHFDREL